MGKATLLTFALRYLPRAIQLANLVADEGHKLYLDFITHEHNRLQEYLGFVRLAHLAALEQNTDPFGLAGEIEEGM